MEQLFNTITQIPHEYVCTVLVIGLLAVLGIFGVEIKKMIEIFKHPEDYPITRDYL